MKPPNEQAIAAGAVLLSPAELAPRLGYKGKRGAQKVIARAKAGQIPCARINSRVFLFHWPTVIKALGAT